MWRRQKSCTKNSLSGFLYLVIPPYAKDKVSNRSAVLLLLVSKKSVKRIFDPRPVVFFGNKKPVKRIFDPWSVLEIRNPPK